MPKKNEAEVEEAEVCGHVDMHSLGPDGKPDHPSCTLAKGHAGDHRGIHKMRVERDRIYDQIYGKLIKIEYDIVDGDVFWSDAAAVPAKDIKVGKMPSRDGGMQDALRKTIQELMQA